jgi:hypothetical protein
MGVNGIFARFRIEQATVFLWLSSGSLALVQLALNLILY